MGLFDRWRRPEVWAERQMARGLQAVEARRPTVATRIADSLYKLDHPGGFELEARAWEIKRDLAQAIIVTEKGVRQFPKSGRLWYLLGTLYTHDGRFDRAVKALDRAARTEGVDVATIRYNQAVAHWQAGRPDEALTTLRAIRTNDRELILSCFGVRMAILNAAEQWDEVIAMEKALPGAADDATVLDVARGKALGQLAKAWWRGRGDAEKARVLAIEAIEGDRQNFAALEVIRQIDGQQADGAMFGILTVEGLWPAPMGKRLQPHGFFREFKVVARNADEALAYARPFLPPASQDGAKAESWETIEAAPHDPLGVYDTTGYSFFPVKVKAEAASAGEGAADLPAG